MARSQDPVIRGVHNDFHQAGRLIAFNGARHIRHGNRADFQFVPRGSGFFFRHANTAQLRIGENAIRHDAIFDRQIFSLRQIGVDDLKIVEGNMRERGRRPSRPRAPKFPGTFVSSLKFTRMKPDLSVSTPALSRPRSSVFGRRPTAASRCVPEIVNRSMRACSRNLDRAIRLLHPGGMNIQMKLDSLRFENFLKFGGDFRILARNDLRLVVKDRDPAPESAEHLSELKPYVSSAEDDQMLGQLR